LNLQLYFQLVNWLEGLQLACPSRKYLHMECPGCGLQRSMIALMRGEWIHSFSLYPALVPMLLLLGFALLHLKKQFAHGASIIRYGQVVVVILIVGNYIYKIINHQIFV